MISVLLMCCVIPYYSQAANDWYFVGINVAQNKSTNQHPGYYTAGNTQFTSEKAVDGNNSTDFGEKSCTHTNAANTDSAFWSVDLESNIFITGVRIFNRSNRTTVQV